jgi:hypothetical protein
MQVEFCREIFEKKNSNIKFMKIRPVGSELFHGDGRTDVAKLIVAFRNFVFAPKKRNESGRAVSSVLYLPVRYSYFYTAVTSCRRAVRLREGGDAQTPDHSHTSDLARFHSGSLGAFTTLWKAAVNFVMSVCPPHGTARLPLDGFLINLIFEFFSRKSVEKIQYWF